VEESYPGQLQRIIRDAGYDYEVVNAGVSGETTAGGLRRVEWVLKSRPDIVILELGANDGLRGQLIEESLKNLRAIITRLQGQDVTVVLAGMKMPLNYGEAYTRQFEGMYQQLADDFQIPLIPFFLEGVAAQRGLNQGDGIHPNAEGYTLVAENVWQVLEPILREKEDAQT
jgi:acyl-CoA thioesterase I